MLQYNLDTHLKQTRLWNKWYKKTDRIYRRYWDRLEIKWENEIKTSNYFLTLYIKIEFILLINHLVTSSVFSYVLCCFVITFSSFQ